MNAKIEPITFVSVVNDLAEFRQNLGASPVANSPLHEWLVIENIDNRKSADITKLYCAAYERARHDLIFFMHQDVYLPAEWEGAVCKAIGELEARDPDWGVLGAVGVDAQSGEFRGHWSDPQCPTPTYAGPLPAEVSSLDELWLGIRKRSGICFDPALPGFHCYGIDLSLTAASAGRRSYAIDAFVAHKYRDRDGRLITAPHQSDKIMRRSAPEFQRAAALSHSYIRQKWRHRLPLRSTSMVWQT